MTYQPHISRQLTVIGILLLILSLAVGAFSKTVEANGNVYFSPIPKGVSVWEVSVLAIHKDYPSSIVLRPEIPLSKKADGSVTFATDYQFISTVLYLDNGIFMRVEIRIDENNRPYVECQGDPGVKYDIRIKKILATK